MSKLISQIKRHEGLSLKPYLCSAKKLTIGYGRNIQDVGISKHEAEFLLFNDVAKVQASLRKSIPSIYACTNATRQGVLENMAFNLGVKGLLGFKKLLAAVSSGNYDQASREMLSSKWASQVGQRAVELAEQMRTGR